MASRTSKDTTTQPGEPQVDDAIMNFLLQQGPDPSGRPASGRQSNSSSDATSQATLTSQSSEATPVSSQPEDGEEEEEDVDDPEMEELLRQLDEANEVAAGLEGRLDEILGDLEGLLVNLEGKTEDGPSVTIVETEVSSRIEK